MILAADLGTKVWGALRVALLWIDSIGFYFIDNAYNIMIRIMGGFNQEAIEQIAGHMTRSAYVLMGIFALFRIAIMLINSIINPDKLTDKKEGAGNVLFHFVGTIFLLIFIPFIFDMGRDLQNTIINGNYIPKFILGTEIASGSSSNTGKMLQRITIKSVIHPDDRLAGKNTLYKYIDVSTGLETGDTCSEDNLNKPRSEDEKNIVCQSIVEYTANDNCKGDCETAVNNWVENKVRFRTLSKYIDSYVKVDGETVFVYEYTPFLTLVIGLFMTWVLISFTIDIAVRSVELLVLEVLSPLFTITFMDPKMASSGPFKKWVTATGKSYGSLFIKIAIVSLMLLLLSNLHTLLQSVVFGTENNFLIELFMVLAILIFAKKAPKWLGDMLGLSDGAGLGGLGIGKKLAGAALVGGALTKAGHTALGAVSGGASSLYNHARNRRLQRKKIREDSGFTHGLSGHKTRQQYSKDNGGYLAGRKAFKKARKEAYANQGVRRTQIGKSLKEAGATLVQGTITGSLAGLEAKDAKAALSAGNKSGIDAIKENHVGYKTGKERIKDAVEGVSHSAQDSVFGDKDARKLKEKQFYDNMIKSTMWGSELKGISETDPRYNMKFPSKDEHWKQLAREYGAVTSDEILAANFAERNGYSGFNIVKDRDGNTKVNFTDSSGVMVGSMGQAELTGTFRPEAITAAKMAADSNAVSIAQQQQQVVQQRDEAMVRSAEATTKLDEIVKSMQKVAESNNIVRDSVERNNRIQEKTNLIRENEQELSKNQAELNKLRGDLASAKTIGEKTAINEAIGKLLTENNALTAKISNDKEFVSENSEYGRLAEQQENLKGYITSASGTIAQLNTVYERNNTIIESHSSKFKDDSGQSFNPYTTASSVTAKLSEDARKTRENFDSMINKIKGNKDKK